MTLHAANHIDRMPLDPLARRAAIRNRLAIHDTPDCEHRREGFERPMRVRLPRTGRDAIVATCIGCGRAYYVLHDGAVKRVLEDVHVRRFRSDRAGGDRARALGNGHGGPSKSVALMATRKDG